MEQSLAIISGATLGTTGTKTITGVGFTPKKVRFTLMPTASTSNTNTGSGVMTPTAQYCTATASNSSGYSRNSLISACALSLTAGSSASLMKASYVSMDTDGFTINVDTASSTFDLLYEAEA